MAPFSPLDVRIRHARDLGHRPGNGRLEMLLVVDAGNTNIVFAVHDPSGWRGVWRIRTDAQRTSDEYAVWLNSLLTLSDLKRDQIRRAVIGTVVPAALYHLRRLCRDWFNVEPLIARAALDWGFEIKIDNPNEVGADRLLNAMAGHRQFWRPVDRRRFRHRDHLRCGRHELAPILGALSARVSTCRWRRCTRLPPACRVSVSAGRRR